jgi:hypothetical protein
MLVSVVVAGLDGNLEVGGSAGVTWASPENRDDDA